MKLPSTTTIIAALAAVVTPILTFLVATGAVAWSPVQCALVTTESGAVLVLIAALVEHTRPGTPSRWVAVYGSIPAFVVATFALLSGFNVYTIPSAAQGALLAVIAIVFGAFGVQAAQSSVYAPETFKAAVSGATRNTPLGTGSIPASAPVWATTLAPPSPAPSVPLDVKDLVASPVGSVAPSVVATDPSVPPAVTNAEVAAALDTSTGLPLQ